MKPTLARFGILAVLMGLWALPAQGQIICNPAGQFTYCDNGGQGSIQADLGHGRGVILDSTTGSTTPYTIIQPQNQRPQQAAPVFIPQRAERKRAVEPATTYEPPPTYSAPSGGIYGYQAPLPYPYGGGQ